MCWWELMGYVTGVFQCIDADRIILLHVCINLLMRVNSLCCKCRSKCCAAIDILRQKCSWRAMLQIDTFCCKYVPLCYAVMSYIRIQVRTKVLMRAKALYRKYNRYSIMQIKSFCCVFVTMRWCELMHYTAGATDVLWYKSTKFATGSSDAYQSIMLRACSCITMQINALCCKRVSMRCAKRYCVLLRTDELHCKLMHIENQTYASHQRTCVMPDPATILNT